MRTVVACLLLVVCTVVASKEAVAEETQRQFVISIKLGETSPVGDRVKILANPQWATIDSRLFSYHSGGVVGSKIGEADYQVGTRINGVAKGLASGAVQLNLEIHVGHVIDQRDPHTDLVQTESVKLQTLMGLGEKKRLNCGSGRWCELHVDTVKSP